MFRRRALRRRLAAGGAPPVSDEQLRRLARALDAGPSGAPCVPGPAGPALRLAIVQAFRYPDLRDLSELRRLPHCSDQQCCNPYHYSRLCEPGSRSAPRRRVVGVGEVCNEHLICRGEGHSFAITRQGHGAGAAVPRRPARAAR
ncbi:unnamed protein product [Euphydryas editha]|uniref:MH1 domain-containing protein n=1 Tax=Euphydryas editha TaxID=104508 RepID=A0AAU9TMS5_EUPED|nr:unnamed protein product [Euphydryas editha]